MKIASFLLQIDLSQSKDLLLFVLTAFVINAFVLYLIIKWAVESTLFGHNKAMYDQLKLQNQLKIFEMIKSGIPPYEVQDEIDKVFGKTRTNFKVSKPDKKLN